MTWADLGFYRSKKKRKKKPILGVPKIRFVSGVAAILTRSTESDGPECPPGGVYSTAPREEKGPVGAARLSVGSWAEGSSIFGLTPSYSCSGCVPATLLSSSVSSSTSSSSSSPSPSSSSSSLRLMTARFIFSHPPLPLFLGSALI